MPCRRPAATPVEHLESSRLEGAMRLVVALLVVDGLVFQAVPAPLFEVPTNVSDDLRPETVELALSRLVVPLGEPPERYAKTRSGASTRAALRAGDAWRWRNRWKSSSSVTGDDVNEHPPAIARSMPIGIRSRTAPRGAPGTLGPVTRWLRQGRRQRRLERCTAFSSGSREPYNRGGCEDRIK